jgi:hypothetical protein
MKIRAAAMAAMLAATGLIVAGNAGMAMASTHIATTTKVIAKNSVGTTPGKLVITGIVKPTSGTAVPTGTCSIVIDTNPAIVKPLNSLGHCSITTHVKLGTHTIQINYSGSVTMAPSSGSTTISVTH